jgi:hypothetical protein
LPDLPEAFPLPELTDLPPDLAELYGEYLRDSRSGLIDAAALPATKEAPRAAENAEQQQVSSPLPEQEAKISAVERAPATPQYVGTSYLVAPEKAEVDALIAALADHVAEPPSLARQELYQGNGVPAMPATLHPFQLRDHIAQAKAMAPVSAAADASLPPSLVQPSRSVESPPPRSVESPPQPAEAPAPFAVPSQEQREAVSGPVQPTKQAEPLSGSPAPLGAPPTVPLFPKTTQELRPLPGDEQEALEPGALEEAEQGTNTTPATFSSMTMPEQPEKEMTEADVLIFVQLQHQVATWVKIAAVSHQIEITGQDIPELVAELRHTAALEEAELQVIESLVALCQRVASTRQATMEDYKQAMMLYLLHHRSRMAL